MPSSLDLLIGTYTSGSSKGIYVYRFDERSGKMTYLNEIDSVANPSYLTVSVDNRFVYAVNEGARGAVSAFTFVPKTGQLAFINRQPTNGADPCYVSENKGQQHIFVANYTSGSLAVFPVNKDGSLGPLAQLIQDSGSGPVKDRQEGPHVHTGVLSPDEKYLLYSDLGADKLHIERYRPSKNPPLVPAAQAFVTVTPGNGPRHVVFSNDGKYLYLIQEIGGAVNAYTYAGGTLKQTQSVSMLTPEMKGNIGSAAIRLSPDGKFLYASNRGNGNDIVCYAVNPAGGRLTFVSRTSSLGKGPRDFIIDPSGKYLIVANQTVTPFMYISVTQPPASYCRWPLN